MTDCRAGGYAESAPRLQERRCRAVRCTPSSVAAGGGVFIAHVVVWMWCSISVVFWFGRPWAAIWKSCGCLKTKNPACFSGEQGSRKSMIYGKIVNYLPASLVRFRPLVELTKADSMRDARILFRITGVSGPGYISAQRRNAVACEGFGYVWREVIGVEGSC